MKKKKKREVNKGLIISLSVWILWWYV